MNVIQTIEADLTSAWGHIEKTLEADALAAWSAVKHILTGLEPQAWAILTGLIETVLADLKSNDMGDILQAVLMQAEHEGVAFVQTLAEDFLNAAISGVKLKAAASAPEA